MTALVVHKLGNMAQQNTFLSAVGLGSQSVVHPQGQNAASGGDVVNTVRNNVQTLFGKSTMVSANRSVDVDMTQSNPMAAKGLAMQISGSAEIVSVDVGESLATFQDPLKVLLGTRLVDAPRVILKRKFVSGSGVSDPLPERAPGRLVSVTEREREMILQRYGSDIEQNTNLLLDVQAAREDMDMKLSFQKRAMETRLIQLGYQEVRRACLDVVQSLLMNNPATAELDGKARVRASADIFSRDIFGALQKYPKGLSNLLVLAKAAIPASASTYDTAIVPQGLQYGVWQKAENTNFLLSGLKTTENASGQPLSFAADNAFVDPASQMTCLLHTPFRNYETSSGTLQSSAQDREGLQDVISWMQFHDVYEIPSLMKMEALAGKVNYAVDYGNRVYKQLPAKGEITITLAADASGDLKTRLDNAAYITYAAGDGTNNAKVTFNPSAINTDKTPEFSLVYVRVIKASMSGIICGARGPQTGELLSAFPSTAVNTNSVSPEVLRLQLRCYLGAAVYREENVMYIPGVSFNGLKAGYSFATSGTNVAYSGGTDGQAAGKFKTTLDNEDMAVSGGFWAIRDLQSTCGMISDSTEDIFSLSAKPVFDASVTNASTYETDTGKSVPLIGYLAATASLEQGRFIQNSPNCGHLGRLDDPQLCEAMHGAMHYQEEPIKFQAV